MANTLPASRLPVVVNAKAPASFYDQIDIDDVAFQWPNGTVIYFSMRPAVSRMPILNQNIGVMLNPPDLSGNNVRYDWQPSDIIAAGTGNFFGWWGFVIPGSDLAETPEFPIIIADHGPGLGTQTGAIADGALSYMPVTYTALQRDSRFGDRRIQNYANIVQTKVLGSTVSPDDEVNYELLLLDYLSKRLALELINPGIDFWSRQLKTSTSSQTSEVSSFPDMIASLKELRTNLIAQLASDWREVQLLVPTVTINKVVPMPTSSLSGYRHVTRNPQTNNPLRTGEIGWGFEDLGLFL